MDCGDVCGPLFLSELALYVCLEPCALFPTEIRAVSLYNGKVTREETCSCSIVIGRGFGIPCVLFTFKLLRPSSVRTRGKVPVKQHRSENDVVCRVEVTGHRCCNADELHN